MENLVIEEVKEEDLETIYEIEKENFKDCWSKNYILFHIKLPKDIRYFFVAREENKVIGYIVCWVSDFTAHLHNISVKKDYQNKGVGTKLLNFLIDILKKQGITEIVLEVRVNNFKAINLYKKHGFKEITIKKRFYPDGEDALMMLKELT